MRTQDIFIAHPQTTEQVSALKAFMQALKIKFEVSKEKEYNPDFVAKIHKSKQQHENGEFVSVEKKNLKNFLGLE
ncbi:MAG: hypothetical protein KF900_00390 [Bacteroidetes bacterium]|nr:hypothetical protein [Bacteroidota bacterium]